MQLMPVTKARRQALNPVCDPQRTVVILYSSNSEFTRGYVCSKMAVVQPLEDLSACAVTRDKPFSRSRTKGGLSRTGLLRWPTRSAQSEEQ